jgi:hypothetical protein
MQIWRMRADCEKKEKNCGAAERVTNDDKYNDWFPHFSPDGKWIVIISYSRDIEPTDHPYYKHCYLRIMPAEAARHPRSSRTSTAARHHQRSVMVAGWLACGVRE